MAGVQKGGARLFEVDQLLRERGSLLHDNLASQGEVAVKPGVPQSTTIGLHSNLEIPSRLNLGFGLHAQARAVSVRPNDAEPITRSLPRSHPRENLSIFICTRDIPLFKSIQNPLLPGSKVGGGGSRFQGWFQGYIYYVFASNGKGDES